MPLRRLLCVIAFAAAGWTATQASAAVATLVRASTGTNFYVVFAPGSDGSISGVRFETIDAAGNAVANQALTVSAVSAGCNGSFPGGAQQLSLQSDSQGVVLLPPWRLTYYSASDCLYQAMLPSSPASAVTFHYRCCVWSDPYPPATPAAITVVGHAGTFNVLAGTALNSLKLSLATQTGVVRGGPIRVTSTTAGCGSFAGASQVDVITDDTGSAAIPPWTPVPTNASCVLTAESPYASVQLSIPVKVTPIITAVTGTSPSGEPLKLSLSSPVSTCSFTADTTFLNPAVLEFFNYPRNVSYPYGLVSLHTTGCGTQPVTFTVEYPQVPPNTAQFWRYGPTPDNLSFRWIPMDVIFDGSRIAFTLTDGGVGDDSVLVDGGISLFGALVFPGGLQQDLWWGGVAENGWGMSLVQHGEKLFANLYVYDASGNPIWYVMPSGTWNSAHTAFTGSLYLPTGSPYYAYDGSRFNIGASVGTLTITFSDVNNAVMDYTIGGVRASKNITRVLFGPKGGPTDNPHADLWWAGSAQNGWGLALLQQYSTIFALWFTYDSNGKATWYVMPGGTWNVKDDYRGSVYKAVGPPWLGTAYDASRHHLTSVGTFGLLFNGAEAATFTYTVEGKSAVIPLTRIPF